MLFQHHVPPPQSTYVSIEKHSHEESVLPKQQQATYVLKESTPDPQYIMGSGPGPYVEEHSRSIYTQLGARMALLGIDARLERTRKQVNYPETYDLIFNRVNAEFSRNKNLKHLILLLGIPIAYPRLQWLETIFSSPLIHPIRFLHKRFGFADGLFNKFDGQIDLLDDLDDHYTAFHHKAERKELMLRLQEFSKAHSVRVTILGGDVHLAAVGRFYTNPKQHIPAESDWRYMANIISSAITNKPPPSAIANLLARRNKIHHLDRDTDETLIQMFDHDPGARPELKAQASKQQVKNLPTRKTNDSNRVTMPSRNFAIISESLGEDTLKTVGNPEPLVDDNGELTNASTRSETTSPPGAFEHPAIANPKFNMRKAIHLGEKNAGTEHVAASGLQVSKLGGVHGLDVVLRVEIDKSDPEGRTEGYAFTIPGLNATAYADQGKKW
jgi:hypothetical protein